MDSEAEKTSTPNIKAIKIIRAVLRISLIVMFLGTIFVWTVIPTKISREKWMPKYEAKANKSTYLEKQGANLLLYTFPPLFAAVVGCVYLHLGQKIHEPKFHSNNKKNILTAWSQPLLVKGPLGIVSGIELAFFVMFLTLITWVFVIRLPKSFEEYTLFKMSTFGYNWWQSRLTIVGTELAITGYITLILLFIPVTRGSSILPLFGLDYESCIKYHTWVGHIAMVLFTLHGIFYIIAWAAENRIDKMLLWAGHVSDVAGEISLFSGLVMWSTTYPSIRRKMFELFLYTHYFYIVFVVFFIYHVGITSTFVMLPGFYLFIIDRFLRLLQSRERVGLVSARVLPCQTLELNFAKSPCLNYSPTSIMFINVPSISKLQWHPFTITSNSNMEPDVISTLIKVDGNWTSKLYQILSSASSATHLAFGVEGPYGPSSFNFLRYDTLVMVSGGSGIASFTSIIRELIFTKKTRKCPTPSVLLIASFKYYDELAMLNLILPDIGSLYDLYSLDIQIQAYVTRQKGPPIENTNLHTRTIMFETRLTDSSVSVIPGQKSWLWLGTIIASSFAMFLLLIGVITHNLIYPWEHNNAKVYPRAAKYTIYMLVMLFSIFVTSSVAYFWGMKQNVEEAKPKFSSRRSPSVADKELGNHLPSLTPLEAATIYYGERPDMKRIISDIKGKNIGVLASGPKTLRADVATICSSGVADNLNFHSISFSW